MKPINLIFDIKRDMHDYVELMQGYSYSFECEFYDDGIEFDLIGYNMSVDMLLANGDYDFRINSKVVGGNKVTFNTNVISDYTGDAKLQILLEKSGVYTGSWLVDCKVKPSVLNEVKNTDFVTDLKQTIQEGKDLYDKGGVATKQDIAEVNTQLANNAESILSIEKKKVDVKEVDVESVPNTIVKRNASGDVVTKKLLLGDNGSEIYLDASSTKCIPSFKDGIAGGLMHLLTSRELQIEKGTFTPYGYGGDNAVNFTHSIQQGTYYRVGKMVTVYGRISASHLNSAAGHFRIGGLPFRVREQYSPCVLGFVSGVKLGSADIQVNAFGELGYQFIQFVFNNTNTGVGWSNVGVSKLITPLDVSFSMTYLTD